MAISPVSMAERSCKFFDSAAFWSLLIVSRCKFVLPFREIIISKLFSRLPVPWPGRQRHGIPRRRMSLYLFLAFASSFLSSLG